jgi:cephalosporin hydroxylase
MSLVTTESRFFGKDYITALKKHYPNLVEGASRFTVDDLLHVGIVTEWMAYFNEVGVEGPDRFQSIVDRPWSADMSAWAVSGGGRNRRHAGAYGSYKGLILLKPAIDLVLYSNLIWELQPQTILEFGSLQGGSGLWFADQLQILCGRGEVHSFELCYKCISPRASHPFLHFHEVDLRFLETLDKALFEQLPHPWLVVDDAHANVQNLIPFVAGYMRLGDYYVIEDAFLQPTANMISEIVNGCKKLGFMVDTRYADAFGRNVTCAPNGWLVKLR